MNKKYLRKKIAGILYFKKNIYKLKQIDSIFKKSLKIDYNFNKKKFSSYLFKNKENAKRVLKSKLNNNFFAWYKSFNQEGFLSQLVSSFPNNKYSHSIILPLCDQQIKFLENNENLNVNIILSKTFFILLVLINLFKGLLFSLKIIFLSLIKGFFLKKKLEKKIFFDLELEKKDISHIDKYNDFFVINQFVKKFRIREKTIIYVKPKYNFIFNENYKYNLKENISLSFKKDPYPLIRSPIKLIKFLFWFILGFFISIYSMLMLNWINPFLFFEATKSKIFDYAEKDDVIEIFLSPYNGSLNKSLWQIDCKNKVKRSYLYFYSTNGDGVKTKYGYPQNNSNWPVTDYDNYLVWDNYQKKVLYEFGNLVKSKIITIGPMINQIKSNDKDLILPKNYVSIFDITPYRLSNNLTNIFSIITPDYVNKFLNDIFNVCKDLDLSIVHKKKKKIDKKILSKKYYNWLDVLEKDKRYLSLNDNVSVEYLIKNSKLVISFPYTSTSIIAKKLDIPTIFYDPSGLIDINEKNFSHGIRVISDIDNLREFLSSFK
ncbi:MAG: hypothetical protein CMI79_06810 [Candidatus Pelagibacter sp.]|nr:hypothetical protein [Candidatus Pelagibacter sp.]|tara:strand:- start:1466 stop:3097 length:1632 start_codon:yes stop_codon:yes gene_type:complete